MKQEERTKRSCYILCMTVVSKESTCGIFVLPAQLATFFMERHFYLKVRLSDKLWLLHSWKSGRKFLQNLQSGLSFQGKQLTVCVANEKFKLSSKNWNFEKLGSSTTCLTDFLCLKTFLMRSVLILTNVTF